MSVQECDLTKKRVVSLAVAMGANTLAFSIVYPFLPIYLHTIRGIPMAKVGLVFPVMGLATIIGAPCAGFFADRIGRRVLMIWGPVFRSLTFVVLALLAHINGPFWSFAVSLFVAALAGMFFKNSADAYLADMVPSEQRTRAFGKLRIGLNIGWMIGPAIGAFLARTPFSLVFLLTAVLCLGSTVITVKFCPPLPETQKKKSEAVSDKHLFTSMFVKNRRVIPVLIFSFIMFLSISQFVSTLSIYSTETVGISKTLLGFLYTINGAIVIVFQVPIDRLLKQWSNYARTSAGAALYGAVYILFAFSSGWGHLAGGIVIMTIGEICVLTALVSAVSRIAPVHMVGRYLGAYGMVKGLGWTIGPYFGALCFDAFKGNPLILPYFGTLLFGAFKENPLLLWSALSLGAWIGAAGFLCMSILQHRKSTFLKCNS